MTDKVVAHARKVVPTLTQEQRDALAWAWELGDGMTYDHEHRVGQTLHARGLVNNAQHLTPLGLAVRQLILEQDPGAGR
ncbi:hypothetical protein [Sphingomonas alpina]|uniref:Uncharacterized protein n=2 Tax=Sphingomonas alpina TaxID=653931 RepID=A0A7H0LK70_9SPHN|nr:hypothetical protein [Sphingomonas alpina]QNQ10073.1 hypothetical protein H3Z74_02140 [Sphingomonas alpina]